MNTITNKDINAFGVWLASGERAPATCAKYTRSLESFALWLGEGDLCRDAVLRWKEELLSSGLAPMTVNAALAAVNAFFHFTGIKDLEVKYVRVQKRIFREKNRELTLEEYRTLVKTAKRQGNERLALVMETICSCGIRVSELKYITVSALREGRAVVRLKGKIREILLPERLCDKLSKYVKNRALGPRAVFRTSGGQPMGRGQIWAEMKKLYGMAGVDSSKVFPHNLRHLFATEFYSNTGDIARLADVLGHSSIETTRIYLITSGATHKKQIESLRLIS